MKTLLMILAALLLAVSIYLFITNRDNSKVSEKAFSVLVLGLGAAIISFNYTLKEEKASIKFVSSFTYRVDSVHVNVFDYLMNTPFEPRYRLDFSEIAHRYNRVYPDAFKRDTLRDHPTDLYLELLTFSVISDLFKQFSNNWTTSLEYKETPTGLIGNHISGKEMMSDKVKWDSFIEMINYDIFKRVTTERIEFYNREMVLHLPVGTKIDCSTTKYKFRIEFESDKYILTIDIRDLTSSLGTGNIGQLLKIHPSENINYVTSNFEIEINSTIKKWKSGHPDVKYIKAMHKTVFDMLETTYSYDFYKNEIKERRMFM